MAKKKYVDYKKVQQELFKRTEGYAANVRKIYQKAFTEIIELVKGTELEEGKSFSFSDYDYSGDTDPIFRKMYSEVYQIIRGGVEKEWLNSNEHNDELVKSVFGEHSIEDNHFARCFSRNMEAMDAFFARKSVHGGLNLSQKVWNYNGQFKEELENALDLAIGEGTPANRIAARVKGYLEDPDRFYRRFSYKVGEDKEGNPIYGRKWKRRIWDELANSYRWIDAEPKQYHPGRGVYRSSARNAQRLARTETNIAYRSADHERWQQLDFVVGIEVKLSNNHNCKGVPLGTFRDICDDLKGKYPKDFKFVGWHPNCRCFAVPVLASEDEMTKLLNEMLDGEETTPLKSSNEIKDMPEAFNEWKDKNMDRIDKAKAKGTLPYFIRDNEKLIFPPAKPTPLEIAKARHDARTPEQIQQIQKAWNTRKSVYHYGNNMMRVMGGISDVDTTSLAKAIKTGNQKAILDEAAKLKAIGKKIYSFHLLDNPMEVARKFSMADAEAVQNAVAAKFQKWAYQQYASDWDSLSDLDFKHKKLTFEINWLSQNHFGKPWEKTWQVSQNAYLKELARVNEAKAWKSIKDGMPGLLAFNGTTKSKVFSDLYSTLADAVKKDDLDGAQTAFNNAVQKKSALEAAANKRAAKKAAAGYQIKFGDECFSAQKKDAAKYFRNSQDANDYFFDSAVDDWALATNDERRAMHRYTVGSAYITEPLRAVKGYYHAYTSRIEQFKKDCKCMTDYINRSHTRNDAWIKRDENSSIFGSDWHLNLSSFRDNPAALVGKETKVETFLSCGSNRSTRFCGTGVQKDVIYNIYMPKGTKATYAEPFNNYGQYDGGWNGKTKPTLLNENEIILQRGTTFRITKAEYSGGMWYIDVDVLAQAPSVIDEVVTDISGFYCKFK